MPNDPKPHSVERMLTLTEAAEFVGRDPETIRRWIRSGRLPARRSGRDHLIAYRDIRRIEDELYPMVELPPEWRTLEDGSPAPNWVALIRRSRGEL